MPKKKFTEEGWRDDPWFRSLVSAFKSCKTEEEISNFIRDIGTLSEMQAWSERLEVAKQLARGLSYRQVAENTGASTTTVTRVAKFIEDGEGGYRKYLILNKKNIQCEEILNEKPMEESNHGGVQKAGVLQKYLNK